MFSADEINIFGTLLLFGNRSNLLPFLLTIWWQLLGTEWQHLGTLFNWI